ncbi:MAG: haloacid dehalogenase-like hydrolase [Desulfarculaceae bacterium]|nr:haloacid dehalogenase-like hydrolase [Desulfarculaceae bacterium]
MAAKHTPMAICYDFDGTLSPRNMQEYDFLPQLSLKSNAFWREVADKAKKHKADNILIYMTLMLEKALASGEVQVSRSAFAEYGKTVELYDGVEGYFDRINEYARRHKVNLQHFIISSGLREMIQGSPIAKHFKEIYASGFRYDQHGVAKWPGIALNYTTKTQYLFRINKGVLDVWDNETINDYVPKADRPVPFHRMIYIGDGTTDVPCMKLVKEQRGHSIAVYRPRSSDSRQLAATLMSQQRVNFIAPADYRPGKPLDHQIKAIIDKVAADAMVERLERACVPRVPSQPGDYEP